MRGQRFFFRLCEAVVERLLKECGVAVHVLFNLAFLVRHRVYPGGKRPLHYGDVPLTLKTMPARGRMLLMP
jgi:hypothetical protein